MSGTPVHVWPHPGDADYLKTGDKIHIACHIFHGFETGRREADIIVTAVFITGDAVMVCGRCGDGAGRSVMYDMDACVERLSDAA